MKKILGLVLVLLLAALLGGLVGEILSLFLPDGTLKDLLTRGFSIGTSPATLDLRVFSLTVGVTFRLTIFSMLGLVAAAVLHWKYR
ncbi:MAG: DUF4321 domain-containing protein [Acidobacteriota bacterium]|nr:MAG: DUF4321 domain-containing protein [Acidobacteriota bacterium]